MEASCVRVEKLERDAPTVWARRRISTRERDGESRPLRPLGAGEPRSNAGWRDYRLVADVILPDGRNLNRELVRAGLAWWYRRYAPHDAELEALEAEARAARRGLWADPHPVPPWEWRRGAVTEGGAPTHTRPTSRGWLIQSPLEAASVEDGRVTPPLDERPVVQPYPDADACERAREEQLSAALRVAKATDADPEAEVTAQAWQRTLAARAARCVPAP